MGASGMTELVLLEENGQTRLRHRGAPLAMRGTRSALPQDHSKRKGQGGRSTSHSNRTRPHMSRPP